METLTIQQQVNVLRAAGHNPIHLFGNVYLVRWKPSNCSKVPFYKIKFLRDINLTCEDMYSAIAP